MPSVKWAIAIEKKNTATAKRRVFYFAYFPVSCPKTDAGFELSGARLPQNRRPLLGRKRGCGGSVFPPRGCTTYVRGCPLEGLAGVQSLMGYARRALSLFLSSLFFVLIRRGLF